MRIEYDKGSILELKNEDNTYTYALCLGIGKKDKSEVYNDLPDYGKILDCYLTEDSRNFQLDVLFGSTKDVMTNDFAFHKLSFMYTWFSSSSPLSLDKVVKGFQKYPFFTYFFVSNNKVMKKEVVKSSSLDSFIYKAKSKRVITNDSGLNIDFLYLKSCVLFNQKPKVLLTVKEYYKELAKYLTVFREKVKDSYAEDIIEQYSNLLTKGLENFDLDSCVNKLYLVETENQYYLFSYLYNDLYIQVGKIDKNKSSNHDKAYFLILLQSGNAFIEQERYKTVRQGFQKFLEKNKNNIKRISYYPYIVLEDLDLRNPKLHLNDTTYSILDSFYKL